MGACNAWDELVKLEKDYLVDLEDAAIIRRDQKGKFHVTTPAHHAVAWGTVSGLFWGTLVGLLRQELEVERHARAREHWQHRDASWSRLLSTRLHPRRPKGDPVLPG